MEVRYVSQPRDWSISVSADGETFSWILQGRGAFSLIVLDPYKLRDAFYRLSSPKQAAQFLRQSGPFRENGGSVTWSMLKRWQEYFTQQQQMQKGFGPPPEYRTEEIDRIISPSFRYFIRELDGTPQLTNFVECQSVVEAIAAANFVDKLCAVTTVTCPWCQRPFVRKNKRSIYCSHKCAHSAATRERRQREKEAKSHEAL